MSKSRKILYWNGVVGDERLREKYSDIIKRLLVGGKSGLHPHRLKTNKKIMSVYVNDRDRLIFTEEVLPDNKNYLCIVKEILNHKYKTGLDEKVITKYVEAKKDLFKEQAISAASEDWEEMTEEQTKEALKDLQISSEDNLDFTPIEVIDNNCTLFTDEQMNATHMQFPGVALIVGAAGSGKSYSLLGLLQNYTGERAIFVSISDAVVREMKKKFKGMMKDKPALSHAVEFKTVKDLLLEL